jgi:glutamyl-tRNA synthetase
MKTDEFTAKEALFALLPVLEQMNDYSKEGVHTACFELIQRLGVKNGWLLWALRTALSGKATTPGGGVELCAALGKDESIKRVKYALERLCRVPRLAIPTCRTECLSDSD